MVNTNAANAARRFSTSSARVIRTIRSSSSGSHSNSTWVGIWVVGHRFPYSYGLSRRGYGSPQYFA